LSVVTIYNRKKTSVYHTVNGDPAHCFTHRKPQKW